jgi:hypothetical protein
LRLSRRHDASKYGQALFAQSRANGRVSARSALMPGTDPRASTCGKMVKVVRQSTRNDRRRGDGANGLQHDAHFL